MIARQEFECDRCGACCRALLIEADWLDAQREPALLTLQDWTPVQLQGLRDGDQCVVLWADDGCPFLTTDQGGGRFDCSIYPTRPNGCVSCEAGGPKCQQARLARKLPILNDRNGLPPDTSRWQEEYGDWYGVDFIDELIGDMADATIS